MEKVRVLVLTSFTYIYGSKASYKNCGDNMYLDPSSPKALEELKFILNSPYLKKGLVYLEDQVIEDYKNKVGYFSEVTTAPKVEDSTPVIPEVEVIKEPITELKEVETPKVVKKSTKKVIKEVVEE